MASIFCCFRSCANGFDIGLSTHTVPIKKQPIVVLDSSHSGQEVVLLKNGMRICGTGGALASTPIMQDKAYFEVRVQQTGVWGLGLATLKADLNATPMGNNSDSWVLCSDGNLRHNKEEMHRITQTIQEGDTIGVSYNHIELNFYVNGQNLDCPFTNVKGNVYPAVYGEFKLFNRVVEFFIYTLKINQQLTFTVDDGAVLDLGFEEFVHNLPSGYDKIMLEQSLLET